MVGIVSMPYLGPHPFLPLPFGNPHKYVLPEPFFAGYSQNILEITIFRLFFGFFEKTPSFCLIITSSIWNNNPQKCNSRTSPVQRLPGILSLIFPGNGTTCVTGIFVLVRPAPSASLSLYAFCILPAQGNPGARPGGRYGAFYQSRTFYRTSRSSLQASPSLRSGVKSPVGNGYRKEHMQHPSLRWQNCCFHPLFLQQVSCRVFLELIPYSFTQLRPHYYSILLSPVE